MNEWYPHNNSTEPCTLTMESNDRRLLSSARDTYLKSLGSGFEAEGSYAKANSLLSGLPVCSETYFPNYYLVIFPFQFSSARPVLLPLHRGRNKQEMHETFTGECSTKAFPFLALKVPHWLFWYAPHSCSCQRASLARWFYTSVGVHVSIRLLTLSTPSWYCIETAPTRHPLLWLSLWEHGHVFHYQPLIFPSQHPTYICSAAFSASPYWRVLVTVELQNS